MSGLGSRRKAKARPGLGSYPDGMVEHDELKALDDLGFAENTIVMYSTDNGAEQFTWPDGGQSPFRGEKNTNWEGGYRYHAPCAGRHDKAGHDLQRDRRSRGLDTHACAAAADPEIKGKLLAGHTVGDKTFKVHLDGYNVTNYLAGDRQGSAQGVHLLRRRRDARCTALVFAEQRSHGLEVWQGPFVPLRLPKLFNLHSDPFETADDEERDLLP
ncbi:hypothetical protein [Sinorhizobium meliloti]|uniref:hypothetical protein n=1 Tax=Rhizobium meliloti TaxID=382 RepID=UPI0026814684